MPEEKKIIRTSLSSPIVLIVNELGSIGSHLCDSLLAMGCRIYYFGNSRKDKIDHLLGKTDFYLIRNLDEIYGISPLNYVFYLSQDNFKYLGEIVKKIKDKNSKFLISCKTKKDTAIKILEEILRFGIDTRFCLFGEIYGPRIKDGFFSSLIFQALSGNKIKIFYHEEFSLPLIYCFDFVKGLNRAIFSPNTSGKIFLLGKQVSVLNFIRQIEKILGETFQVSFEKKDRLDNFLLKFNEVDFLLEDEEAVPLEEGLEKTINWLQEERKNERTEKRGFIGYLESKISFKKKFILAPFLFLFFVFSFFLIPFLFFQGSWFLARKNFDQAFFCFKEKDLLKTKKYLRETKKNLTVSKKIFNIVLPLYHLVGLDKGILGFEPFLVGGEKFLESSDSFLDALGIFSSVFVSTLKGQNTEFEEKINKAIKLLDDSYLNISLATGVLEGYWNEKQVAHFLKIEKYLDNGKEFLKDFKNKIILLKGVCLILPQLTGNDGQRVYLVILQNNLEIRATGGLISSVGVFTFNENRLVDFEFNEASEVDSLLKGKVEPPLEIKSFLGEENWLLKDANWDPDFNVSAKKIVWFFEKATGRKIDGVFAFDLNFLKRALEIFGEIEVFGEKVNNVNLFEKSFYFSSPNFSGSGLKEEFMAEITKNLFEKIRTSKVSEIELVKVLMDSFDKKEILFYPILQPVFDFIETLNWDGKILKNNLCQNQEKCIEDFVFPVESNFGKNRVNYLIKRTIHHKVLFTEEQSLKETFQINWENLSITDSWPAGQYRNYFRIYLPSKAILESVLINDPKNPTFWVEIAKDKIQTATRSGLISYGFLVEIPPKGSKTVEINYMIPGVNLNFKEKRYILVFQKQSGAQPVEYSLEIFPKKNWKPLKILPNGVYKKEEILINQNLDEDKIFMVDFSQ